MKVFFTENRCRYISEQKMKKDPNNCDKLYPF